MQEIQAKVDVLVAENHFSGCILHASRSTGEMANTHNPPRVFSLPAAKKLITGIESESGSATSEWWACHGADGHSPAGAQYHYV